MLSPEDCCSEVESRRFQAKPRAVRSTLIGQSAAERESLHPPAASTCGIPASCHITLCNCLWLRPHSPLFPLRNEQDEHSKAFEAPASSVGCLQASCLPSIRPKAKQQAIPQHPDSVQVKGEHKCIVLKLLCKKLTVALGR
jgi:hypothetical protein